MYYVYINIILIDDKMPTTENSWHTKIEKTI